MSEELVDILDDEGNVAAVVPRGQMRGRRLPHRCVYVFVLDERDRLLVHERTPTKDVYPSFWDVAVGGVLASGEGFDAAARREAAEELGVAVEPVPLFAFRYEDERTVVRAMTYLARHGGPFAFQPSEVVRGEFVTAAGLAELVAGRPFCPDGLAALTQARRDGYVRLAE